MTKEELIEITNNIDIFEKFKMYMHYVIIQLGFLLTLLPSVDDTNSIYNYIGYKLLLWH